MTNVHHQTPAEALVHPDAQSGYGWFDFHNRVSGEVESNGNTVPYDLFEPDDPIDDVPILINNGYCAPPIVYDALAVGLAQNGRRVIRPHATRHVSLPRAVWGGHLSNPLKKHSQANWEVVKDARKRFGIRWVDELGHSMGTPTALLFAKTKPEVVRSVMCTGGAGLDGAGGIIVMGGKSIKLLKNEVLGERDKLTQHGHANDIAREVARHILSHPFDTLAEGYHVSRTNALPRLIRVRAAGIRVGAILFGEDSFFNADAVLAHTGGQFDFHTVIPDAKHIHPQLFPFRHAEEQVAAFAILNSGNPDERAA